MRKDVKIGMAVGGVLLAMAIVFALFSSHPAKTEVAQTDTADAASAQTPENAVVDTSKPQDLSKPVDAKPDAPVATDTKPADTKAVEKAVVSDAVKGDQPKQDTKTNEPTEIKTADGGAPTDKVVDVKTDDSKPVAVAKKTTPAAGDKPKTDAFATTVTPTGHDPHAAYGDGVLSTSGFDNAAPTGLPSLAATDATPIPNRTVASAAGHKQGGDSDDAVVQQASANEIANERTTVTSSAAPTTHVIRQGETFSTIAAAVYGDSKYYKLIVAANPQVSSSHLKIGQTIQLPAKSGATAAVASKTTAAATPVSETSIDASKQYRVKSGDSLHKICMKLYGDAGKVDTLYNLNKSAIGSDPAKLKLGMVLALPAAPTAKMST